MVAKLIQRRIVAVLAAAGAFFSMGASPALANSSSAASADIVAPVRDARATGVNAGDEQFKQLFSSWQSLDNSRSPNPVAPTTGVAIPSRAPLAIGSTSSGYGMRSHPVLGGMRAHKGIDLAAPTGTPVYATADGTVGKAEWFSSYGLFVSIDHGAELETRYAHMSRLAVGPGERVRKGDVIGYVGSTGRSTGPHLHYEVRVAGQAVNPIPYMAETDKAPARLALAGE
ncbi:Murein DD-endopeptidase MepM [Tsuneonella dongtanensis]|uniref:Murein DD-endopeptidase MepM n=1 Tax=Tsuneonella dongtanensis TaxID=692370 RepID=A0A1B2A9N1_9SPHN|nr:Murein DD-endopeptidase MepM [Tsuneonella dongtanensis]